jgi:hypothetical protein
MDNLQSSRTLTGVEFQYTGSLHGGLVIFRTHSTFTSSRSIIDLIRLEIQKRSPVLMGANRDKPNPYSIGNTLLSKGHSPQHLSYVIPLLIEAGFCEASKNRPFVLSIVN